MSKFPSVPAYSIGGKRKQPGTAEVPGPGAYTYESATNIVGKKSPGVAIGHAPRDHNRASDMPGPGAYSGDNIFMKPKGGYIGMRKPIHHSTDTPGPGAYSEDRGSLRGQLPGGYSFGKSRIGAHLAGGNASPGPGAYYAEDKHGAINKGSGYHLGKAARNILNQTDIPGPGAYSQESGLLRDHRGPKLGKAARDAHLGLSSNSIGPGGYEVPREFDRHSSKGYRMGKAARQALGRSDSPGPGQYDIDQARSLMAHNAGSRLISPSCGLPEVTAHQRLQV